jgi:hypothetical protein
LLLLLLLRPVSPARNVWRPTHTSVHARRSEPGDKRTAAMELNQRFLQDSQLGSGLGPLRRRLGALAGDILHYAVVQPADGLRREDARDALDEGTLDGEAAESVDEVP